MASEIAPGFLVAAPSLLDPNFVQTVVLLIDHRAEGSLGFVVNRPANIEFKSVVEELKLGADTPPDVPVLVGGPVEPHTGWVVFDPTKSQVSLDSTIKVSSHLRVSASRELLNELAHAPATSSDRHLLVLGYAGWAAGQLDAEIQQGAWVPVDLEESVLFETPYEERWQAALAVLGIDPKLLVGRGSLPQA